MQKYMFILLLFLIVMLTGCNESLVGNNNEQDSLSLNELEKVTAEKDKLERILSNAEDRIEGLEKEVSELKLELKKQQESYYEKEDLNEHNILRLLVAHENELKYILDKSSILAQSVSIVGYNSDSIVENYEEVWIKGLGDGEYFKVEVIGSIYDFQLIKLEWNDESKKFKEVKVIHELDEVRNQTVYIETYLPCGMPSEKIKWKDSEGHIHEIYLGYDGYGFDGSIIWSR